jgi:hypothetical protein
VGSLGSAFVVGAEALTANREPLEGFGNEGKKGRGEGVPLHGATVNVYGCHHTKFSPGARLYVCRYLLKHTFGIYVTLLPLCLRFLFDTLYSFHARRQGSLHYAFEANARAMRNTTIA